MNIGLEMKKHMWHCYYSFAFRHRHSLWVYGSLLSWVACACTHTHTWANKHSHTLGLTNTHTHTHTQAEKHTHTHSQAEKHLLLSHIHTRATWSEQAHHTRSLFWKRARPLTHSHTHTLFQSFVFYLTRTPPTHTLPTHRLLLMYIEGEYGRELD